MKPKIDFTVHSAGEIKIYKMTDSDRANLQVIMNRKKGWFTIMDVYPKIKRGRYSLDRLEKLSQLEVRFKDGEPQYRLRKII